MHHCYIDKFAYQDSVVHRLDCRVKLVVVLLFTAMVISIPKTSLVILVCYAVWPFALLVAANIPLLFVFRHILIVSPVILVLALSCAFYDRRPMTAAFGPFLWETSTGWIQCFNIMGKFIVTMLALIGLISTTKFSDLLVGLQKLGVPRVLTIQLGFLYRYIFLLIDKAQHILRARSGRRLRNLGFAGELKTAGAMLGSLLVRSLDAAQRTNMAMEGRGFSGRWSTIRRLKAGRGDLVFVFVWICFMLLLYLFIGPVLS